MTNDTKEVDGKIIAELVLDLFAAIKKNPAVLAAMKRPESVRVAADKLLAAVGNLYGV